MTDKPDAVNQIDVYVNNKTEIQKISLDLTNYFAKEVFQITIEFIVGENNENSAS